MILDFLRPPARSIWTCRFQEVRQIVACVMLRQMKQARLGHHIVVGVLDIWWLISASVMNTVRSRFLLAERSVNIVVKFDFDRVFSENGGADLPHVLTLLGRGRLTHDSVGVEWARSQGGHAHAGSAREHVERLRGAGGSCYLKVPGSMVDEGRSWGAALWVGGKLHLEREWADELS